MNLELLDPFSVSIPESILLTLEDEDSYMSTLKYSRNGTYVASGCLDGKIIIWDNETHGTARILNAHANAITSVSWSKSGRFLLSTSKDWSCIFWDLKTGKNQHRIRFDVPVVAGEIHSRNASCFVICPSFSPPILVNLSLAETSDSFVLVSQEEVLGSSIQQNAATTSNNAGSHQEHIDVENSGQSDQSNGTPDTSTTPQKFKMTLSPYSNGIDNVQQPSAENPYEPQMTFLPLPPSVVLSSTHQISCTAFDPTGQRCLFGTSKGYLFSVKLDTQQGQPSSPSIEFCIKATAGPGLRSMRFDHTGRDFAVSCLDRCVRVYSLPSTPEEDEPELLQKLMDSINRNQWCRPTFSPDGEYVLAGVSGKTTHNIYIWDKSDARLVKILQGPKEPVEDLEWQPQRRVIASVAKSGTLHIWDVVREDNWSAFAPDFVELEENIEYEEQEDEFDIYDTELISPSAPVIEENTIIDVEGIDHFVDPDLDKLNDDEVFYIPVDIEPDIEDDDEVSVLGGESVSVSMSMSPAPYSLEERVRDREDKKKARKKRKVEK